VSIIRWFRCSVSIEMGWTFATSRPLPMQQGLFLSSKRRCPSEPRPLAWALGCFEGVLGVALRKGQR
jgi:hypothetical protein